MPIMRAWKMLMRSISSTSTAGPANGAQPASSTPARSDALGHNASLRRGSVAKMEGSSIGKVMQGSEHVGTIRIQHREIAAVFILSLAPLSQQGVRGEKAVLVQIGRVQQQ